LARTAQTAEETYFTDNQTYASQAVGATATTGALNLIETTLTAASGASTPANGPHGLVATGSGTGFTVSVTSGASTPVTYTITNNAGTVTRSCTPASTGGCNASSSW
jgi:P pilus assembly chaperone PapD